MLYNLKVFQFERATKQSGYRGEPVFFGEPISALSYFLDRVLKSGFLSFVFQCLPDAALSPNACLTPSWENSLLGGQCYHRSTLKTFLL